MEIQSSNSPAHDTTPATNISEINTLKSPQLYLHEELLQSLQPKFNCVYGAYTSLDGTLKISANDSNTILVTNVGDEEAMPRAISTDHKTGIKRIIVWEGIGLKKALIITMSSESVRVCDLNGKFLRQFEPHLRRINCVGLSDDLAYENCVVVTGGVDNIVLIHSLKTGKVKHRLSGHECEIKSIAFLNAKGYEMVVSIDKSNQIRFWDRENGKCLKVV